MTRHRRHRRPLALSLVALALALSPPVARAQETPEAAAPSAAESESEVSAPGAAVGIGVAPFERVAPPGAELPDVATLLADRLGTRGVERVVGPAELGASAQSEPDAATAKAWAEAAGVAALAVGRTTRIGNQLSVDVRLRSGETGAVVGTYVTEIVRPDDLAAAVDRLAGQLVDGALALAGEPAPAPVSAAPEPSRSSTPFALGDSFDGDQPISIESEELEAFQQNGQRRLFFKKNVKVVQGDVTLTSHTLEALYPDGSSQPQRLIAKGRVRLVKRLEGGGSQSALCDHATYDRQRELLVCRGNAELREGEDRLRGSEIVFDLAKETVKVKGGASVVLHPEDGEGGA